MLSMYFLEKFGLGQVLTEKLVKQGFQIIDFFQKDNERALQLSLSIQNKVQNAILKSLPQIYSNDNIYDDIIMLKSIGVRTETSRIYQLTNSIEGFKELFWETDWQKIGLNAAAQKAEDNIREYLLFLKNNRNEQLLWLTFIYFLKRQIVEKTDEFAEEMNSDIISELLDRHLIKELKKESRYVLNVNNIVLMEEIIQHFHIDSMAIRKASELSVDKMYLEDILTSDKKDIHILKMRLDGATLQEIGDYYNISREYVRQKLNKVYATLPPIEEIEKSKDIFQKYDVPKEIFLRIFNGNPRVYELLGILFRKGTQDIIQAVLEGDYSSESKAFVRDFCNRKLSEEQERKVTKESTLTAILEKNQGLQTYFTAEELLHLYLEEVGKDNIKLAVKSVNSIVGLAERSKHIILSSGDGFRYYKLNITNSIQKKLIKIVNSLSPGAYSMNYVFAKNIKLMKELELLNGSELHNIYKLYNINFPGFELNRNPEFIVGVASKKEFIFQEMIAFNQETLESFIDMLSENYGLHKGSISSYVWVEFNQFIKDGIILIDSNDYSELVDLLMPILTEEIYSYVSFKSIIHQYTPTTEVTPLLIYKLGYRYRGSLVVHQKYGSSKQALTNMILKNDYFHHVKNDITRVTDFYTTFYELEKEYKILKLSEDTYVKTETLVKEGFDQRKLDTYISDITVLTNDSEYFTIKTLMDRGLSNHLLQEGLTMITLDRLISTLEDIRPVNISYPTLYYKGEEKKFLDDFLVDYLDKTKIADIYNLTSKINEEFGLDYKIWDIKSRLSKKGIEITDK